MADATKKNTVAKIGKRVVSLAGDGRPLTLNDNGGPSLVDDLLWGTRAIANEIGRSLHETQYLIRIRAIPFAKLGPKTIIASRRQLRRALTPQEAAE
jgi:hypothetical protein